MRKKINILVIKDEIKQLKKGSIVSVPNGYAFNYLIPKRIAEVATKGKIKHYKMFNDRIEIKQRVNEFAQKQLKKNIEKITKITLYKKSGENHLIFGSITEKEIINWIKKYTNLTVSKTQIQKIEMKSIGLERIVIKISSELTLNIPLRIIPANI